MASPLSDIRLDMKPNPYASIQECIRLPAKCKLTGHNKLFNHVLNQNELSEPLVHKTNDLLDELNDTFQVFQHPKDFQFTFPDSIFPPVPSGESNTIKYQQKNIVEQQDTFKNRLSEQQLQQIQESGQFKVRSNIDYITLPYVWRINNVIYWGKNKVHKAWLTSLSTIYGYFFQAERFIRDQVPLQLGRIRSIPRELFTVFFGSKSIQTVVSVNYQQEIFKDFWNTILTKHYKDSEEWFSALWKHLYVYYDPQLARPLELTDDEELNKKKQNDRNKLKNKFQAEKRECSVKRNILLKQQNAFNADWNKRKKRLIIEITDEINGANNSLDNKAESEEEMLMKEQEDNSDERILEQLANKRLNLYVEHLERELPKDNVAFDVVNAIVLLIRIFTVIRGKELKFEKEKQRRRKAAEDKIKRQHTIKSLYRPYFNQLITKEMQKINNALEQDFYQNLQKDPEFTNFLSKDLLQTYREFLHVKYNFNILIEAKKMQKPQYHGPFRTFYSTYRLLPPYKIIKENNYYSLKKFSDYLTVDTSTNFWKVRLYWMRLKTWTINCLVFLLSAAWKGPLGLRCLWGIQDFDVDMRINYQTGQISYEKGRTVLRTFKRVLKGIKKSRAQFQQAPDLGLLGKNVSRIFNYIECYIFRFLFVGILLTLIGYPIAIVFSSALTVILVVTFWAWIPIILLSTYLFNIFIKQFQTDAVEYGFFSRTFPLIRITAIFFAGIAMIIFSILSLVIFAPFISLFVFAYCLIAQFFRRVLDKIMMTIFRYLGRTPSRDTMIAKKISGPGMSKEFYMSINEQDVYILVRANLERQFMLKLIELTNKKIQQNSTVFYTTMTKVLEPFGVQFTKQSEVINNKDKLKTSFHNQSNRYLRRYPTNPQKVRFTQEEIDNYFPNTVSIVKNYVDKHEIQGWIFQKYDLYEDMFDELTRYTWMEIFSCGEEIFEPLEKLDCRFKLEDQYKNDLTFNSKMKKGVGSIMNAMEGEVALSHHHQRLTPFKHNLLNREQAIEQIELILNIWSLNSIESVHLQRDSIRTMFIPNLNIKEITTVQNENRLRDVKNQTNIIDI